jgi:putative hydrolase of the HAD superfamily
MKAVVFDLYETLITEWDSHKYTRQLMAADLGVSYEVISKVMKESQNERNLGKSSIKDAIVRACQYQKEKLDFKIIDDVIEKRMRVKQECYAHLRPDIENMLQELKTRRYKLGLISNCSLDEVAALRDSKLASYFDAVILSYEVGMTKPDPEIYRLCTQSLQVEPKDCLYVGDGGSQELWGAQTVDMAPLRAMWFLYQYGPNISPMPFDQAATPMDVIGYIDFRALSCQW